ncbi:MAG: protein kinase [Gemmataceae bacterium]|nr:protein kinase [Gemmataceae bacterium]
MAKKTLLIDTGDGGRFLLAADADGLRVGDGPAHTAGLLRGLRVVRVRCEVEVEDDRDDLPVDEPGVLTRRALRPGTSLQVGHARLSMSGADSSPSPAPVADAAPEPEESPAAGPRRLKVIDGGDQGRAFRLPDDGTVTVGKPGGEADIGLHDFYVMPVHCSLELTEAGITVTHVDGASGTLIDGQRIAGPQVLRPGHVLRVGNSHLKLEVGPFADEPPAPAADSGPKSARVLRPPPPEPEPEADPEAGLTGQMVGHYRIGRLLGRGHTGAVYEAVHAQTGQGAALKVFDPSFPASSAELDRFAREVKAAQAVRHPNLVTMYGAGRSPAGCWLARECVPGESAAEVIARVAGGEKPSWTRAARVAVHLARALDGLHGHRLVHGNITPNNVLLRAEDLATKLADLRLAQALDGSRLQKAVLEEKLLAELPYLAPEQADPGAFVDDLADLYAVGAVAYALIAGRPPVGGDSPEEILEQIQAGRVVRPSQIYRKVPPAFDGVVMKLLARHQEDRYPTAAALLADLAPLAESHDLKV